MNFYRKLTQEDISKKEDWFGILLPSEVRKMIDSDFSPTQIRRKMFEVKRYWSKSFEMNINDYLKFIQIKNSVQNGEDIFTNF